MSLYLVSDHWASQSVAYLAVEITAGITLIPCLILAHRFRWVFGGRTDIIRTSLFMISAIVLIIYFVLDLTTLGEDEMSAVLTYKYYILYIFTELSYRISEFTILFVIIRTVNELAFVDYRNAIAHRKTRYISLGLLSIVGLVSLMAFSLIAAYYGSVANYDFSVSNLVSAIIGFLVTYNTLYMVASLYSLVVAVLGVVRQRSRASLIMLFVAMSLLLRVVVYLADVIVDYYFDDGVNQRNLDWANSFIYNIMVMVVYVGVTAVAMIGSGFDKHDPGVELAPFAKPHVYE